MEQNSAKMNDDAVTWYTLRLGVSVLGYRCTLQAILDLSNNKWISNWLICSYFVWTDEGGQYEEMGFFELPRRFFWRSCTIATRYPSDYIIAYIITYIIAYVIVYISSLLNMHHYFLLVHDLRIWETYECLLSSWPIYELIWFVWLY